jgi:transcriptional regulator with XRE-family HTH domain
METVQPSNTLGQELRQIREMRRLSQRDIETATGISNAYLSQLENDKIKKPSPFFLHKLASLFGIEYEFLMQKAGYVSQRAEQSGAKTLVGAALFAEKELSEDEERELAKYLSFLRSQKKNDSSNVIDSSQPA